MSYTKSHWFSIEFIHYIVSGIGLIATVVKADTTLLSCIGLGRYFEPCFRVVAQEKSVWGWGRHVAWD